MVRMSVINGIRYRPEHLPDEVLGAVVPDEDDRSAVIHQDPEEVNEEIEEEEVGDANSNGNARRSGISGSSGRGKSGRSGGNAGASESE